MEYAISGGGSTNIPKAKEKYWDDTKKSAKYLITDSPMRRYMDVIEVEETLYWLKSSPDDLILDLGCGSGRQLSVISENYNIIGVDRSIGMLQRTKKIMNDTNAFLILGDVTDLPFRPDVFTKIISVRVVQHLNEYEKMRTIRECHRILVDGGIVQITNYQKRTLHHLYILVSLSPLRHPLNILSFIAIYPVSIILRLWKVKIDIFSKIFSWKHPEIVNFSSASELSSQLRQAQFSNVTVQKYQVGDVFISTILSRAWSKSSNGTISKTFSISNLFFPIITKNLYDKWLQTDRRARIKKPLIWYFRFKDKIIAMGEKRTQGSVNG
jgi:ubiquinone/menaquinone biosynthesis C-methylase UbiE